MNTPYRFLLALSCLALLPIISHAKSVDVVQPKLVGLYFHASWCANCKTLDPKVEAASEKLKKSPFLLVTLDVSNKVTQHQAGMLAAAMGYEDIYAETGLKTGFIILVNTETGQEVARISKSESSSEIVEKIMALTEA